MPHAGGAQVRPLQGGTQVESKENTTVKTDTLGLVIVLSGVKYFVTAGHVVGAKGTLVGQPTHGLVVGTVEDNFLADHVDIAKVKVAMGVGADAGRIWTSDTTSVTVTFEHQTRPKDKDTVYIQGKDCGALKGTVEHSDVDITFNGEEVKHACLVTYQGGTPVAGDSGSPIVSDLANGARCWGVHGGKVVHQSKTFDWFSPFENLVW